VDLNLFNEANSVGDGTSTQLSSFSDKFIAMYLGAHGHYNALDTILDAAIELRYDENVLFVLVGDGERKKHLMARVISEKLTNVLFFDPITRRDCPEILSKADCFLLPNLAGEFFDCNLPNKLFDYLASSRPIIVAGFVESARLVNKINAGFVIGAEEPEQLAEAVKKVSMLSQKERIEIGERGSLHVKKYYNRQKHADTILSILKDVIR
jgi:glycosyltransferase involved in cell wall biosynthesis